MQNWLFDGESLQEMFMQFRLQVFVSLSWKQPQSEVSLVIYRKPIDLQRKQYKANITFPVFFTFLFLTVIFLSLTWNKSTLSSFFCAADL